jgi:hypothetical protein
MKFGWTCILDCISDYLVEHVCWIIFKLLVLACRNYYPRLFLICMWYYFVAACINEMYSCLQIGQTTPTKHNSGSQSAILAEHPQQTAPAPLRAGSSWISGVELLWLESESCQIGPNVHFIFSLDYSSARIPFLILSATTLAGCVIIVTCKCFTISHLLSLWN